MRMVIAAVVLAAGASLAAEDDGNATWAKAYPKAGSKTGQILVKGFAKARTGYTLHSASATVWPEDGGEAKKFKVDLNKNGTFGETVISGLDPGSGYNVFVEIAERRGDEAKVRRTSIAVITAP